MPMLLNICLLAVGLFLVIKGGSLFVDASVQIAEGLNVPRIVVGGTIVSLATTSPELVVSTTASWMGDSGIAIGNAVGSVIANIGLIVGIIAFLAPVSVDKANFRNRSLWMLCAAILVILFSISLEMGRFAAFLLVVFAMAYLAYDYKGIMETMKQNADCKSDTNSEPISLKKPFITFIIGAFVVVVGSKLLVTSGVAIANALQIPSIVIGLTVIAIGTSLPELVTAIISVKKGIADLSIGNIVGANILNLSMITGAAGLINPLTLTRFTRKYSFSWMMIMMLTMIFIFWRKGKVGRKEGIIILVLYVIYFAGIVIRSIQYSVMNPLVS